MPIYTFRDKKISEIKTTQFGAEGIQERSDLQAALRDKINVISPDTLVIAEEFSGWTEGARRIDLLGIDKQANLVVIELKRDETGAHMELQALRYAAMVSTLTFKRAAEIYQQYLDKRGVENDAEAEILNFLDWSNPLEEQFPTDTRIVLASSNFSKELTTAVMWLNERDLDIRCVRLQPYKLEDELLLNIEQIIPLPEAEEYQVKVREQAEAKRAAAKSSKDNTKYQFLGNIFNKRQLVLAIVTHYFETHPGTTFDELQHVFPNEIHSSYGVVALLERAQEKGGRKRYFLDEEQLLTTEDNHTIAVCNQWGIGNIGPILEIAKSQGYQIEEL
ncbi:membrane protein [Leptolyngbya sp. Heron Island J]|uniref:membrane protein n=1 Tax=Leptolyngbya sp. Heron Island J TaxID=1385935 RepID=UPI0003B9C13D|nr:membrane protein [Leptolyngbya sp. Heron Island J]ESA32459.1 membrane protein [Leptolyngbya sp. Heron Island J]